jgi:superoxide dismutase, Fe-Mn family
MPHALPKLPYEFNALEPHIDAKTMEIHYTKHHQAYVDKLNAAIAGTEWEKVDVEELLRRFKEVPEDKKKAVRNHGGGHANHSLFWTLLRPNAPAVPADLQQALDKAFGSVQDFKVQFSDKATNQFGSGWAWLVVTPEKKLEVLSLPNQDSPLMDGKTPILGLDVWEHAYYLKYQNRRPEYVAAFWSIVDWNEVERRWKEAVA